MTTFSQQEVEFLQNHGNEVGELSLFGWVMATDPLNVPRGQRSGRSLRSHLIFVGDSDKCTLPELLETTGWSACDPPRPPPVSSASASDCLCLRTRRLTCRRLRSLSTYCSWIPEILNIPPLAGLKTSDYPFCSYVKVFKMPESTNCWVVLLICRPVIPNPNQQTPPSGAVTTSLRQTPLIR